MPPVVISIFPNTRYAYPEDISFCDEVNDAEQKYMVLSVVVPNKNGGEYFEVVMERGDYNVSDPVVSGFVNPNKAFKVKLQLEERYHFEDNERITYNVITVEKADFYHCYLCGIIPLLSSGGGSRGHGW